MTRVTKYNMNNKENRKDKKKESGLVMGRPSSRTEMLPAGSGLNRAAWHHMMLGKGTARRRLQISKFNFRLGPSKKKIQAWLSKQLPLRNGTNT